MSKKKKNVYEKSKLKNNTPYKKNKHESNKNKKTYLSQNTNSLNNQKITKKKKRKLRKSRVFLSILFLILVFFLFKLIIYTVYNINIYNNITNSKDKIPLLVLKDNKVKLYKKTINYIHKNTTYIKIKSKELTVTIPSSKIKNNMIFNYEVYSKKINNDNFNYSKALYIDSNDKIKMSKKISITLPRFLYKNNVVDIYGITKKNEIELIKKTVDINGKNVSFSPSKKYERYFITYVKVSDIQIDNSIEVLKNDIVNFKIKYIPTTATNKKVTYYNIGDDFLISNGNLLAKKVGNFKIQLGIKNSNIKKQIEVIVKKNEPKIEVKNGLTYINGILIVNKTYSLPKDYNPGGLKDEALKAFEKMRDDAKKDNIKLWIASGFRSYETQDELYNYYVEKDGKKKADTYSARAGYSEHQTGYAMDLNIVDSSFEGTKEAIWIEKNSYKYGFIIRYPKGKEKITGYKYEPWHIRYLGEQLSTKVYNTGLTLEEYLDIKSKYSN